MRTKAKLQELEQRVETIEERRRLDVTMILLQSREIRKLYDLLEKLVPKDDLEKAIEEVENAERQK